MQIAADKRRVLEGLKEEFDIAIRRAEEEDEMLRDRGSRMQNRVSQRKEEIESAFDRIEKAVSHVRCPNLTCSCDFCVRACVRAWEVNTIL